MVGEHRVDSKYVCRMTLILYMLQDAATKRQDEAHFRELEQEYVGGGPSPVRAQIFVFISFGLLNTLSLSASQTPVYAKGGLITPSCS